MRHLLAILLAAMALSVLAQSQPDTATLSPASRPKVALVLGGGGAKGMAHVGVLKVIERAGIPIDMICGTSIGSLIGGLYAIGYSASELETLVRNQDWKMLLSDKVEFKKMNLESRNRSERYFYSLPLSQLGKGAFTQRALVKGQNLSNLFSQLTVGFHDSIDFSTLPIPYCAVATDIVRFQEVDIRSGYVGQAMRASMSIPAMFSPVRVDSMLLVDGGLRNNYPVDVARKMGADYVIGVNLNDIKDPTFDDFKKPGTIITQMIKVHTENKFHENWANSDIAIQIDAAPYHSMSFNRQAVDTLIVRGEQCAMRHWDEMMALKQKIGLEAGDRSANTAQRAMAHRTHPLINKVEVSTVEFLNVLPREEQFLRKKYKIAPGELTIEQIENVMTTLREQLFYNDASYHLKDSRKGYKLVFDTEGKKASQLYLGMRFDSEELAALQVEGIFPDLIGTKKCPYTLDAKIRLGKRIKAGVVATMSPSSVCTFTFGYNFNYNDLSLFHKGSRAYDWRYGRHQAELGFKGFVIHNFLLDIYVRYNYFHFRDMLSSDRSDSVHIGNCHYYGYHARVTYNSEDRASFTTRGASAEAQYALYTTNFVSVHGHTPINVLAARWRWTIPLGDQWVIQPGACGRIVFGDRCPIVFRNYVGGPWYGHSIDQQMPFAGLRGMEIVENAFVVAEMPVRYAMTTNNFWSLTLGVADHGETFKSLFSHRFDIGLRAGYAYRTLFGPLGAYLGWNSLSHKMSFYINFGFGF